MHAWGLDEATKKAAQVAKNLYGAKPDHPPHPSPEAPQNNNTDTVFVIGDSDQEADPHSDISLNEPTPIPPPVIPFSSSPLISSPPLAPSPPLFLLQTAPYPESAPSPSPPPPSNPSFETLLQTHPSQEAVSLLSPNDCFESIQSIFSQFPEATAFLCTLQEQESSEGMLSSFLPASPYRYHPGQHSILILLSSHLLLLSPNSPVSPIPSLPPTSTPPPSWRDTFSSFSKKIYQNISKPDELEKWLQELYKDTSLAREEALAIYRSSFDEFLALEPSIATVLGLNEVKLFQSLTSSPATTATTTESYPIPLLSRVPLLPSSLASFSCILKMKIPLEKIRRIIYSEDSPTIVSFEFSASQRLKLWLPAYTFVIEEIRKGLQERNILLRDKREMDETRKRRAKERAERKEKEGKETEEKEESSHSREGQEDNRPSQSTAEQELPHIEESGVIENGITTSPVLDSHKNLLEEDEEL